MKDVLADGADVVGRSPRDHLHLVLLLGQVGFRLALEKLVQLFRVGLHGEGYVLQASLQRKEALVWKFLKGGARTSLRLTEAEEDLKHVSAKTYEKGV